MGHEVTILSISFFIEGLGAALHFALIMMQYLLPARRWPSGGRTALRALWQEHCVSCILPVFLGFDVACGLPAEYR